MLSTHFLLANPSPLADDLFYISFVNLAPEMHLECPRSRTRTRTIFDGKPHRGGAAFRLQGNMLCHGGRFFWALFSPKHSIGHDRLSRPMLTHDKRPRTASSDSSETGLPMMISSFRDVSISNDAVAGPSGVAMVSR